jgi:hypothetical protein
MPQNDAREGIYLDLPHDEYLADPALGSSSIKALAYSPAAFWYNSTLNPAYVPEGSTKAQTVGTAFHVLTLEGPAAFKGRFILEPGPEYMRTVAELSDFVRSKGEKPPKLKSEVIDAVLAIDPTAKIYDAAIMDARAAGKQVLKEDDYASVVTAGGAISANPALAPALSGEGRSEVSIFWTEDVDGMPVRLKARFDRLKPRAIVDLKKIQPTFGRDFATECRRAIASYRYDIQVEHYFRGRSRFAEFWNAGLVFGAQDIVDAAEGWGSMCAGAEDWAFCLIFWAFGSVPFTWGAVLSPPNPILEISRAEIDKALAAYARCSREFEPGQPWLEYEPLTEITIDELPAFFAR